MNEAHLDRLLEEQTKGLENCHHNIEKWEKYKKDYEILQTRLSTLPDKISFDVMVPFGSLAMMPGRLIHTNEILVLLGEDHFVERSAKQAAEIAGRRIKQCEKMLNELYKEKEQFENWRKFTGEIKDDEQVEIIEDYDPEKEKAWRERHRKNVQEYHRKLAEEMKLAEKGKARNDMAVPTERNFLTDSEIQDRLSFLEKEEEKNDELASDIEDTDELSESSEYIDSDDSGEVRKGIKWKDEMYTKSNTIHFTHTTVVTSNEESNQEEDEVNADQSGKPSPLIQSPSDIYKNFDSNIREMPKSILKTKSSTLAADKTKRLFEENESTPIVNDTNIYPLPKYQAPPSRRKEFGFQDSVSLKALKPAVQETNVEAKTSAQPSHGTSRPVSRFKAQRISRET